ncbi:MAG: purine-binding chemotaxis protein CheW, partial [Candidatus Riflebacteria bacterium]|nr:purine-binding chemotaxis protein CheW [Candidatus Riflebacteria bacterium]
APATAAGAAPAPAGAAPAAAAEEPEEEVQKETIVQLVSFRMAGETYALEIRQVEAIINLVPITRVPKAPTHIDGVINLRGEIVPVINLRKRLKLPEIERHPGMQIVILSFEEEKVKVGFLVDNVSEVLRLPEAAIEPPSHVSDGIGSEHLNGVGKLQNKIIILLNAHKIVFG